MKKRKKEGFKLPEKTCWPLYSLQSLPPEKFVRVFGKVRSGEYTIIK